MQLRIQEARCEVKENISSRSEVSEVIFDLISIVIFHCVGGCGHVLRGVTKLNPEELILTKLYMKVQSIPHREHSL